MPPIADKTSQVTLKINSIADQISLLSEALHALCVYATKNEKFAHEMQLAAVEALNNVVIHAYHNEPDHEITVIWQQENHQLRIEIVDYGSGISSLPLPELPDFEKEGSRGWWIINACVDEYFYQVHDGLGLGRLLRPGKTAVSVSADTFIGSCNVLTLIKRFDFN